MTAILSPQESAWPPKLGAFLSLRLAFFTSRYDFLKSNFKTAKDEVFKFNILQHSVVAIKGEEGRKTFFDNKNLSFTEGYKVLMGAAPRLQDISTGYEEQENVTWFNKHLLMLLNRNRLADGGYRAVPRPRAPALATKTDFCGLASPVVPILFADINEQMELWGRSGSIDPFKNVYDLVFLMTARMATCRELTQDMAVVQRLQCNPTALLLPWLPTRAKKDKNAATQELFTTVDKFVEDRKQAKVPSSDAIDVLLGQGLSNQAIVGFILGTMFAGVLNTGINVCWILLYLRANPTWQRDVTSELKSLVAQHTDTTSSEPLHKRLSAIPISAWEDEMPIFERTLRETLRLVMNGAALRRNIFEDVEITGNGKTVKRGEFMTYQLADAHLNSKIYQSPNDFDPDRYLPGREEDKKEAFAFLGWGVGRHPCTGMKVAKMEIKMITALFLLGYEYDLVDAKGQTSTSLPRPNYNDIHQARPIGEPCYFKFKRVVD
ncbi:cytochrome P450 [Infundibulicybe gibba]|nr:cytochrome P450 [Infundibulicybe gibba]